jgi:hypothetical protein
MRNRTEIQNQIRSVMVARGWKFKELGAATGFAAGSVRNVAAGYVESADIRSAIETALGQSFWSAPETHHAHPSPACNEA